MLCVKMSKIRINICSKQCSANDKRGRRSFERVNFHTCYMPVNVSTPYDRALFLLSWLFVTGSSVAPEYGTASAWRTARHLRRFMLHQCSFWTVFHRLYVELRVCVNHVVVCQWPHNQPHYERNQLIELYADGGCGGACLSLATVWSI